VGGTRQDLDRANGSGGGGFDIAFSLIERKGDAPLIQSPPGSNTLGVDPKLGNLRNNGGPTLTQKPAGSSKAVDHGDSSRLDTDQRGSPRRVNFGVPDKKTGNGTDIGAVELRRGEVPNAKCAGKLATIIGGSKVINGTKGRDIIAGTQGKNVIRGRGGRDILCGRGGRDRLIGGPGRDRLIGGPGRDRLLQ
jgi:Ca2+-binding RTX toxin-like protein